MDTNENSPKPVIILKEKLQKVDKRLDESPIPKGISIVVGGYLFIIFVLTFYWGSEPDTFDIQEYSNDLAAEYDRSADITGFKTIATLMAITEALQDKPGGYLSNDVTPPGVFLDNVPNWEFGVLVQVRDFTRALRRDISRSQSQSTEDEDLIDAENQVYFNNDSWIFPQTESEYTKGVENLESYLLRLSDAGQSNAQFYARADNLRRWLREVETRLGSLSQRLSASIGKEQLNIDLAGEAEATQSTSAPSELTVKTPWLELDDVFYEARGAAWALIHILQAIELDFAQVLEKKNATISLRQIIRELEPTQATVWSPLILNGNGLGFVANHSLVMGSYVSRANAAIIDLRNLLEEG